VASTYENFVYILLGKGDGTFQSAVSYAAGYPGNSLVAADFNGDGIPDIAAGNDILLSNGDGTFRGPLKFPSTGNYPAAGDFNGDGAADLAIVNGWASSTVSVYLSHPVIALYPPKLVFANQGEGTTSPIQTVTVSNPGSPPFDISSITAVTPFAATDACGTTVAVGTNCAVSLTFSPSGTGQSNGFLTLADSVPGSPQAIPLSGLGVNGPAVTLSPASLSFDGLPVGQTSAAVTATLQNTGNALLTGITIAVTGDFTETSTCGSSLGMGATCTISVEFVPTARGVRQGAIAINSNAGQSVVSLAGIGLAAVLSLSTNTLDLGPQFVGSLGGYGSVTVTSAGDLTLNMTSISASGDFSLSQSSNCSQPLPPGSSCYVSVNITPTAVGTRAGTLTFVDNGVGTQPSVALTATATYAVPQVISPLAPATAAPGSAGFTLTVNGSGFAPVSVVQWKGSTRPTTYVSPTQLTAAIPASDVAAVGTAVVRVFNPAPGGGTSDGAAFEITNSALTLAFANRTFAVGQGPNDLIEGDFNGDGKTDLVVANDGSNTISVLLGNGDGTFRPHVDSAAGYAPESLATGDFNLDGKQDLAILNGDNTVSILLGNGDGTFQAPLIISGQEINSGIAVGDFNGDGKLDLAVGFYGQPNAGFQILLGNGDGTFRTGSIVRIGDGYWYNVPLSIVVRDFNRDGKLDLSLVDDLGDLYVILGKGDGTFQTPVQYQTAGNSRMVVAGDFNGDGILDLATTNFGNASNSTVSVLLGNGDGTFQPHVDYSAGQGVNILTVADINGDGILDLARTNALANAVSVMLGNGDGTFQENQDFATGTFPYGITSADFNGDGRMDLAVANISDNNVSVLLQVPPGSQPAASVSTTSLTFSGQGLASTSSSQIVILNNTGGAALTISSIVANGDFAQTNTCGSSVAAGGSCTISVTFTPTAAGARSGSLTITDNNNGAAGSTQTVTLSGTGTAPTVSLSAPVTFAAQAVGSTSSAQTITLTNSGTASLTFSAAPAVSGPFAIAASGTTCSTATPVVASGTCTVAVTFTPTAGGSASGSVSFSDNAPGSPQSVALSGTGTAPAVSLSAPLTFTAQMMGSTSSAQTITLTNSGNANLTFSAASAVSGPFAIAASGTTCSSSNPVAANSTCTVAVTFTPTAGGAASGSVSFSDNAVNSPQSVALSGTGEDFTFTTPAGSSTTASVTRGQTATFTLSVGGQGGISGTVTFTCTGAPSQSTCTVSPNPLTVGGTAANVTVTVTTTAAGMGARPFTMPPPSPGLRGLWMLALGMIAVACLIGRCQPGLKRRSTLALLAFGVLLMAALAGCGGGGSIGPSPLPNPGTPGGTYPLTVTATTGSGTSAVSHSMTLTLTVN
jgi:hypothetical protein